MKYLNSSLLLCLIATNAVALGINLDESKSIKSDFIEYNVKTEELKAVGNTEIINASGQKVKSDSLSITKDKTKMDANDIELWLGSHVYLSAKEIDKRGDETIAHDAIFTACDGCDAYGNAWVIASNKVIHDADEKMLYFHNSSFWIYDQNIPIFWLPYYEMPDPSVDYKSGLLTPSFNTTNGLGTQFNIPLYINFSERHDLTTTFSYLTQENPLFQAEHRLNLTRSTFRTTGAYTHNKLGANRWYVFNDDIIELGENARASVFINKTSDKTFLQRYGFYDYQPYLDSGAKIELFGQNGYVVSDAHFFQELRKPYGNQNLVSGDILPNIRGVYQTNPFFAETYLNLSGDVLGVSGTNSSSQRVIGMAQIVSPWTLFGGNRITLSASARYDIYNFDNTDIYDGANIINSYNGMKTRFLPSAFVEWGLPLFSTENNWIYIIEPRARLTVMEHTDSKSVFAVVNDSDGRLLSDTTLFSDNRYAGLDVWENANFADYGIRWAGTNQKHNIELFLGQTYDFNTSEKHLYENGFRDGFSDYVGRASYNYRYFQFLTRFRLDRNTLSFNHTENSVFIGRNGTYLSVGHIWDSAPIDVAVTGDKDTHEMIFGGGLRITKRLRITGATTYNAHEHVFQSHSGAIYYDHPCYFFSLQYRRDNSVKYDYVGGVTLKFKFGISIDGKHF